MEYAYHQIQIPLVMRLNLMIMHYITKYALIFKVDYLEEMDIIKQTKRCIEQKA